MLDWYCLILVYNLAHLCKLFCLLTMIDYGGRQGNLVREIGSLVNSSMLFFDILFIEGSDICLAKDDDVVVLA